MIPFRRILFPVDYSEPCHAMVRHVRAMADHFHAEVILAHAFEPPVIFYGEFAAVDPRWPDLLERERERLAKFAEEQFPGMKVARFVEEGGAAETIRCVAKREQVDLVMMPTTGRGAVKRFLLGSVTTKVLHDVDCAVWTETHEELAGHEPEFPYRSILCAVGWSDEAAGVVRAGAALAKAFGARLTILHAVELPPPSLEMDLTPYRDQIVDASRAFLKKVKQEASVDAETVVVDGALTNFLREQATGHQVDLVLTGRGHAQGTLSSLWSRLYGIVRQAPCPVLSV